MSVHVHFFRPTDSIRQSFLHTYISFANSERVTKVKVVEFTQESLFMRRKLCAEIESEFDV